MKKIALVLSVAGLAAAFVTTSPAAAEPCSDGSSQVRDENGNPTNADKLADLPDGGVVYGDQTLTEGGQSGYIGASGSHGYIELSGSLTDPQLDGKSNDGPVSGTVNSDGVKLQGVNCA